MKFFYLHFEDSLKFLFKRITAQRTNLHVFITSEQIGIIANTPWLYLRLH